MSKHFFNKKEKKKKKSQDHVTLDKFWLQTLLKFKDTTTLTKKINMDAYFENPSVKLHVLYILIHISNFVPIKCYLLLDS